MRWLCLLAAWLWSGMAWAQATTLVLLVPQGAPPGPVVEALLLTLVEPVAVVRPPPVEGLADLGVSAQIAAVRPILEEPGVLAAAWVETSESDLVRLVLVFASEGRSVVRLVDEPAAPGAEQAVAMATRELLLATLLSEPEAAQEDLVAPDTRPEATSYTVIQEKEHYCFAVTAAGAVGIGDTGPAPWGNLTLRGWRTKGEFPLFGVGLGVRHGRDERLRVTGIDASFGLHYRLVRGPVHAVPGLEVEAGALAVEDTLAVTSERWVWVPQVRIGGVIALRIQIGQTWVGPQLRARWVPISGEVWRRSDSQLLVATGPFEFQGGLQVGTWI